LLKEKYRLFKAIPSNVRWGTFWVLISITGFILVMTGHGIKLFTINNTGQPVLPSALPTGNYSENDTWGIINENQSH